jgi:hypothetical protein
MYQQLNRVLHVMHELILSTVEMLTTMCQPKQVLFCLKTQKQVPIASHQLSVGDDIYQQMK